jgi:hypothetical protein
MFWELKALDLLSCTALVGTINSLYRPQSFPLCLKYSRRMGPWNRQCPLTPDSKLSCAANINITFTLIAYIYEILHGEKCTVSQRSDNCLLLWKPYIHYPVHTPSHKTVCWAGSIKFAHAHIKSLWPVLNINNPYMSRLLTAWQLLSSRSWICTS